MRQPEDQKFFASFFQKRRVFLLLVLTATPALAERPNIVPTRDVSVTYLVTPAGGSAIEVKVNIQQGGAALRASGENLPFSVLIKPPASEAFVLQPMLKLFAKLKIGSGDMRSTMFKDATFVRHGTEHLAGLMCETWSASLPHGSAAGCITRDGVILRGKIRRSDGLAGSLLATHVQYGALPPVLFALPPDYQNTGPLKGWTAP